ncbi:universal stress protein [Pontibacter amylolyticus]|uniref:Universal stress protein UspA n=1 Tax=Pontibacter amylolyticus TaxID=1424080 RepID=A0ABQ1VWB1_9BACT|nr:universal stress protein [Pontibacter amylolyticus]GGG02597.1 universal stress protein UspA [Pontibacter amylolyticus]
MKIIVPTDFSDCSKIAVRFAKGFTRQLQAELILLHVLPNVGPTIGRQPSDRFKQELLEEAEEQFSILMAEITADGFTISHEVAYGAAVEKEVESFVRAHAIDMVIMGSKGASGLKKVLLGSNTVDVINHCSVPVVVVPEHISPRPITHLLYASDLKNLDEEVEALLPYARLLQATIKIIHVPPVEYMEHFDKEKLLHTQKQKTNYQAIEIELLEGDDIATTIERYAAASQGEILAMFTHHTSFLEQLFRHSITREIVWHNQIPLLVINTQE